MSEPRRSLPLKHFLWAAVPAALAFLRLSDAVTQASAPAALSGVGFVLLAVAWFIRPPFSKPETALSLINPTVYRNVHTGALVLIVAGVLWRMAG